MKTPPTQNAEIALRIREAYPDFSDERLLEAQQTLIEYASIILRLMDHLEHNPDAYTQYEALQKAHPDLRSDPWEFDLN